MKQAKIAVGVILAITMILAPLEGVPGLFGVNAEMNTYSAENRVISTVADWETFIRDCNNSNGLPGETISLGADIVFGATVPVVNATFRGTFKGTDANNESIQYRMILPANAAFVSTQGSPNTEEAGLFRKIENATIQNLVVVMNGNLYSSTTNQNNHHTNDYVARRVGVITGWAINSSIRNCAVLRGNGATDATFYHRRYNNSSNMGAIVGEMSKASIVAECFADVNIIGSVSSGLEGFYVGGIAGSMYDSATIRNCAYRGETMELYHRYPNKDNLNVSLGGIVGFAYSNTLITDCITYRPAMRVYDVDENNASANGLPATISYCNAGTHVGLLRDNASASNCNGSTTNYLTNNSWWTSVGGSSSPATPNTSVWTKAADGAANLNWLVSASMPSASTPPSITLSPETTLHITPAYLDYNKDGDYDPGVDSAWNYSADIPTLGKMPTPGNVIVSEITSGEEVTNIAIDGPAEMYSGMSYALQATMTGGETTKPPVTWKIQDKSGNVVTDTWMLVPGLFAIPQGYSGNINVVATCGEVSGTYSKTVNAGKVEIGPASGVTAGEYVEMKATLTGSSAFVTQNVEWEVISGTGATINKLTGVFHATKAGTYTVQATVGASGIKATRSVTVAPRPNDIGNFSTADTVAIAVADGTVLTLSVTGTTEEVTWSAGGDGASITHTVSGDATVTASAAIGEETKYVTFNITVTSPPQGEDVIKVPITGDDTAKTPIYTNTTTSSFIAKIQSHGAEDVTQYYQYIFPYSEGDSIWQPYNNTTGIVITTSGILAVRTGPDAPDNTRAPSAILTYNVTLAAQTYTTPEDGVLSDGTSSVKETTTNVCSTGTVNLESLVSGGGLAGGAISVTITPTITAYGTTLCDPRFYAETTVQEAVGEVTLTPTILPGKSDVINPSNGIRIQAAAGSGANTILYYTITPDGDQVTPHIPDPNQAGTDGRTHIYSEATPIAYPTGVTSFTVRAVAKEPGKRVSDVTSVKYESTVNLQKPEAPTLLIGEDRLSYSPDSYYSPGDKIYFSHSQYDPDNSEGSYIRYTLNNLAPSESTGNTYSAATARSLPEEGSEQRIRALYHDSNSGLNSDILDVTVRIRQKLDPPSITFREGENIQVGAEVRPGQVVYLTLSDAALNQLDPGGNNYNKVTYTNNLDAAAYGSNAVVSGAPIEGLEYISVFLNGDEAYSVPTIRYRMDENDVLTNGINYTYGLRIVRQYLNDDSNIPPTYAVTYVNPQPITLNGAPGTVVMVRAAVKGDGMVTSDSNVATSVYIIRGAVEQPTIFPATTAEKPTQLKIGDRVVLNSAPGTRIFYTDNGTRPSVTYNTTGGYWTAQNSSTMEFTANSTIEIDSSDQAIYTIIAIAVDEFFAKESSAEAVFRYELPKPVQAVSASPSAGTVVKGTKVSLYCADEDAVIYYTTNGSSPEAYESTAYNPNNPIVIDQRTTIRAIAVRDGASSAQSSFTYSVASSANAPTSSLATGSVVYKGTRISLASASGTIAYTTDGSDPQALLSESSSNGSGINITVNAGGSDNKDKVFYGENVVIDADYGESMTVRAYATMTDRTPSSTTSFTYTVCEKEDYLTAVPESGSVIYPGSTVTLSTVITGGKIFYTVGGGAPQVTSSSSTNPSWGVGAGTQTGSSVVVDGQPGDTVTISATVRANGSEGGVTQMFTYQLVGKSAAPTSSIPTGAITMRGAKATLSAKDATIYYTTDGTNPTTSSRLYSEAIVINDSMILKAMAVEEGKLPSDIVQYSYTFAGQVSAPIMNTVGGEIDQGSQITLSCATEGATIYYTTDGSLPTTNSFAYTAPITVMRPITLKVYAVKQGLHDSVTNSSSYTVREPEIPEPEEDPDAEINTTQTDRLQSRRTYSSTATGPKYSGVILTDGAKLGFILTAPEESVPKDAKLVIRVLDISEEDENAVKNQIGYAIANIYDITLERDGEVIQPDGVAEIGIPIPKDHRNGVIVVCRMNEDGSLETLQTSRLNGVVYVETSHFSKYVIAVPEKDIAAREFYVPDLLVAGLIAVATVGTILLILYLRRKRRGEGLALAGDAALLDESVPDEELALMAETSEDEKAFEGELAWMAESAPEYESGFENESDSEEYVWMAESAEDEPMPDDELAWIAETAKDEPMPENDLAWKDESAEDELVPDDTL